MEFPFSRRPSVDTSSTVFHVQQGQASRGQAMSDVTPPALPGTSSNTVNQAHAPSLDRSVTPLSTQEVAAPVTHGSNQPAEQDQTALMTGIATCLPPIVAGSIGACAGAGPLGLFMASIGVSTSACMTLSAAAHDAALIRRSGPEAQSQRCAPDSSPTTVCGVGLVAAGIGLTGLGLVGAGVPTAAVPFTLIPTWVGIATVSVDQCLH